LLVILHKRKKLFFYKLLSCIAGYAPMLSFELVNVLQGISASGLNLFKQAEFSNIAFAFAEHSDADSFFEN